MFPHTRTIELCNLAAEGWYRNCALPAALQAVKTVKNASYIALSR